MEKTLEKIGEKNLLRQISKYLGKSSKVIRSFSEDCAVIDTGLKNYLLVTVDSLVDEIHFQRKYTPSFYIGRKALKVNISDISSMGGIPLYALVSLGIPSWMRASLVTEIYKGIVSAAHPLGINLVGGNLSSSPVLFVDIILIGEADRRSILMRNQAKEGDSIFVTGHLGTSAEGLKLLRRGYRIKETKGKLSNPVNRKDSRYVRELILSHLDPPCLNRLARNLASWKMVHAMIDLSDGVASDLYEICRESHVGARLDIQKLPLAPSVVYWEKKRRSDPIQVALYGGEDYHLLFTVPKKRLRNFLARARSERIQVFEIGEILNRSDGIYAMDPQKGRVKLDHGFQHFVKRAR